MNHHLAQLLEQAVVIGAVHARVGNTAAITAEASFFYGDDPVGPDAPPEWERIGDSWSARLTASALAVKQTQLELQSSHARVESPDGHRRSRDIHAAHAARASDALQLDRGSRRAETEPGRDIS